MYGQQNKWCFVPCCKNTSVNTSNKLFVRVPQDFERKKRWFKAARRDMPKSKSEFFCCEDHFNLEEDMENYVRFKMMGGKIMMKRDVVPHLFDFLPDRKRTASNLPAHTLPAKRERKRLVAEAETTDELHFAGEASDAPSTSTAQMQEDVKTMQLEPEGILEKQKSIGAKNALFLRSSSGETNPLQST